MSRWGSALPAVTLSEAQAFARVETGEEEALLAGFVRSASAVCEAFLNQVVIARPFTEELVAGSSWTRLRVAPVRSVETVESFADDGSTSPLAATGFSTDIDASGDGWIRLTSACEARVRVSGMAGLAIDENDTPEPIRHGVLRLVGHMFASRDGGEGDVPAAVTALWRPYRRLRVA